MKKLGIFLIGFFLCAALHAQNPKISNGVFNAAFDGEKVVVSDAAARPLFALGKLQIYFWGKFGEIEKCAKQSETSLLLEYKFDGGSNAKFQTLFCLEGGDIVLKYSMNTDGETAKKIQGLTQYIFGVAPHTPQIRDTVYKHGIWTRVEGGTPYEKKGAYIKLFEAQSKTFAVNITGNQFFCGKNRCTAALKNVGDGKLSGEMRIVSTDLRDFEIAAKFDGQKIALHLSTEKPFNIFESGAPEFKLDVTAVDPSATKAECAVKAFDFDGKQVCNWSGTLDFSEQKTFSKTFVLPEDRRNIFFIDASVKTPDATEYFTRTNAAILPPHKYKTIETSRMGLSGNFAVEKYPEVAALFRRLGVRLIRNGDNSKTSPLGFVSFVSENADPDVPFDEQKHLPEIARMLDRVQKSNAPWFEFGNEWSTSGTARRDMNLKRKRAANYAKWLRAIRGEMTKRKMDNVKVMSVATGGAGGDTAFFQMLHDEGVWELLDAMNFHPGRGACFADKIGGGWTYLGGVQNMQRKIAELGGKPLFLTETYAVCMPNNAWSDSYRLAADNVMLTFALGYAEDIAGNFLFKFNDGISWDINGISDTDREFHYGIMMRDFSPKPSMMAYAAAAEHLDGAKFVRKVEFSESPNLKVYEFSSPRGTFHLLYDRTDGYSMPKFKVGENAVHKEPWIDTYTARNQYEFSAKSGGVWAFDSIGRGKKIPVKFGKTKLVLTGAPIIVYGLDLTKN